MFVECDRMDERYCGYNPEFARRARAARKRREREERAAAVRAAAERHQTDVKNAREARRKLLQQQKEEQIRRGEQIAREIVEGARDGELKVSQIIASVAAEHGMSAADILSPSRARRVVFVRQIAMAEVRRQKPHFSLPQIGRAFQRDHTTVLYALRRMGMA